MRCAAVADIPFSCYQPFSDVAAYSIPKVGGFFEIEFLGRLLHLGLELIDQLRQRFQSQAGIGIILQGLGGLAHHLHQVRIGPVLLELAAQLQKLRIELLAFLPAAVGTTPCSSLYLC